MREIHYTFVVKLSREDELWEGEFEDRLGYVLEGLGEIEGEDGTEFDVDLLGNVKAES